MSLSTEQLATNAETWEHINNVMRLLARMQLLLAERMFTHDRTKLIPPEVEMFTEFTPKLAKSTYGSEEYRGFLEAMGPALKHHYANNRHHPEHFDDGVEGMTLIDLLEMVCDWKAATLRHNDGSMQRSLEINADRFGISNQLARVLANTADLLELAPLGPSQKDLKK